MVVRKRKAIHRRSMRLTVRRRPIGMSMRRTVRRRPIGMGMRRTVRRRPIGMRRRHTLGRGILDTLKSAHAYVKKNRLISRGANLLGFRTAAKAANVLGYGSRMHRRRAPMRRRIGGRVIYPSIWTTGLGGLSATTG